MAISGVRGAGQSADSAQDSFRIRQRQFQQRSASEGKLEITTAEGDKVTLSFSQATERSRNSTRVDGERGIARTRTATQSDQRRLTVSVEGDLSEKELADIGKLVDSLASASRSLQSGNTGRAGQAISQANQLDSISQYSYQYQASADTRFQTSRINAVG